MPHPLQSSLVSQMMIPMIQGDTPLSSAISGKIKAEQSKRIKLNKSFPLGQVVTGKYVIAVIDKYDSVTEFDETNNIIVFGPIQ